MYLKLKDHLPNNSLELFVYALAVWRISNLFVNERGPWKLFVHIRELSGIEHDESGTPVVIPDSSVFSCFLCTSIWVSLFTILMPNFFKDIFAGSALAIFINRKVVDGES